MILRVKVPAENFCTGCCYIGAGDCTSRSCWDFDNEYIYRSAEDIFKFEEGKYLEYKE